MDANDVMADDPVYTSVTDVSEPTDRGGRRARGDVATANEAHGTLDHHSLRNAIQRTTHWLWNQ